MMDELRNFTKRYGLYPIRFRSTDFCFANSMKEENMAETAKVKVPKLTVKDRIRIFQIQHKEEIDTAAALLFGAVIGVEAYLVGRAIGRGQGLEEGVKLGRIFGEYAILKDVVDLSKKG